MDPERTDGPSGSPLPRSVAGLVVGSMLLSLLGVPVGVFATAMLGSAVCAGGIGDCMMGTAVFGFFLVPASMALIGGLVFRWGLRKRALANRA